MRRNLQRDRLIFEEVRVRGQGATLKELAKKWKISATRVRAIYHVQRRCENRRQTMQIEENLTVIAKRLAHKSFRCQVFGAKCGKPQSIVP